MKKQNIAIVTMLGVIGLITVAPAVFASETQSNRLHDERANQESTQEHQMRNNENEDCTGDGYQIHGKMSLRDNHEDIRSAIENGDFETFKALILSNAPDEVKENITNERLDHMQERFDHMTERFENGNFLKNGNK